MISDTTDELECCRAALAASEARFRDLIGRNRDAAVVVDSGGLIRFKNAAATSLLRGLPPDRLDALLEGPPDEAGSEVAITAEGRPETVVERRAVETEWEGSLARLVTFRDVTAARRSEETLRRQAEALRDADRSKDEFLAMLAHELRNPLAEVTYAFRLMRPDGPDERAAETREAAERQLRHLARVVDDLLDAARIAKGSIDLKREPVDVRTTARRVVDGFGPQAEAKGHSLALSVPDEPLVVEADVVRLEQVIANLVDNALRFSFERGRVDVTAEREDGTAVVRVRDNGVGITPDVLPHVFDLFRQADRSPSRSRGGLGIGLTLVRRLGPVW